MDQNENDQLNRTLTTTMDHQILNLEKAQDWIQQNIVEQAQAQDQNWRKKYFIKVGLADKLEKPKSQSDNDAGPSLNVEATYQDKSGLFQLNFFTRTNTDVRNNYIQKLINHRIMQTGPSKQVQTMTIFDWDDTLLCTTYLGSYGFIDLPQEVYDQLEALNQSGARLLERAVSYGDTYIITNAAQGWVEYSSRLYMPRVHEVIFDNKIVVISARHGYEDLFPGDCSKWKVEAFKNIKKNFLSNLLTNIICLGDSHIEIDAAHVLAREFNQSIIKTIKFRENPKPDELVKQQDLVCEKFEQIYTNLKNLTIRLEKKSATQ